MLIVEVDPLVSADVALIIDNTTHAVQWYRVLLKIVTAIKGHNRVDCFSELYLT